MTSFLTAFTASFDRLPGATGPNLPSGLSRLRTDLYDLAFDLDLRGNSTAAELALRVAHQIGELLGDAPRLPPASGG